MIVLDIATVILNISESRYGTVCKLSNPKSPLVKNWCSTGDYGTSVRRENSVLTLTEN